MQLDQVEDRCVAEKANGKDHDRLRSHKLSLTCVCVDSKNQHAYTAAKDGTVIKWSIEERRILSKISPILKKDYEQDEELQKKHHTRHINCIAISSDDRFLATGGWDKKIRIWSPKDLSWITTFSKHRQEVTALVFRQGHSILYSASNDRAVNIWTLEDDDNRCYVESLYGHESPVTSIDVLKKERVLTSGGRDQTLRIWKIVEGAQAVYESKHESVDVVKYVDDKTFISGGEDGTISVWTTMKRAPAFSKSKAHKRLDEELEESTNKPETSDLWITALASFSLKEPKQTPSSSKRRKLKHDDDVSSSRGNKEADDDEAEASDGEESDADDDHKEGGSVIALIASGSCSSEIRLWDLFKAGSKYELRLQKTIPCPGFVNDLQFASDGKKLIAACGQEHKFGRWLKLKSGKNCIKIFDLNKYSK